MKDKIALIYEGVSAEKQLLDNIERVFFGQSEELVFYKLPADGNIYMLWERLKRDNFDTDIISVVKEMCRSSMSEDFPDYPSREFSSVYLFFDYDLHSKDENLKEEHRSEDIIQEMLETFDNETENGKLYISYPMIESIRDVSCAECSYKTFYIPVEQSPDYKAIANPDSDFKHYPSITREMWTRACKASINQASIMVLQHSITEYKTFIEKLTQSNIYGTQRTLFLEKNGVIVVLNALPMFLLEFYSEVFWNEVISLTTDAEATDCDL